MFDHILLDKEQVELLYVLVEATRNIPREKRQKFIYVRSQSPVVLFADERINAYIGDIEILAGSGLLNLSYTHGGSPIFDVTPLGFRYYEYMKKLDHHPVKQVESEIRNFLNADIFQKKYPKAYQKWSNAEAKLWESDSEKQLTEIGHLCREAMQEFAEALVEQYQPPNFDKDKAHIVARLKSVIGLNTIKMGTKKPFFEAIIGFWGEISDLVQRQEHGGQKEGQELVWQDGRLVVFQTAIIMFEIDIALSRSPIK